MPESLTTLTSRSIPPKTVQAKGNLTTPRSYGVYELPETSKGTRRFRYGNHPVRMIELERDFKKCALKYLFLKRADAEKTALLLNKM